MKLRELPGTVGAEIIDSEMGRGTWPGAFASAGEIDEVRRTLDERHLLLIRGQSLSGEAQTAFAGRFGPLLSERQMWGYVSNVRDDGIVREGALLFHSAFAFTPRPTDMISLHAIDVPTDGAPTRYANAVNAARILPADLRTRLEGRRIVNIYDFHRPDDQRMLLTEVDPRAPVASTRSSVGTHVRERM